jgi:exodeoxyribonuclease-3
MKIATWNVNGVRARRDQLLQWMEDVTPDVVCLQEIKVSIEKLPGELAEIPGWHGHWHGAGGYSGVALLCREGCFQRPPMYSTPTFDFEERCIVADFDEFTIATLYVPNGGKNYDDKLRFLSDLSGWTAKQLATGKPLILAGDLNIAREDRDVHPKERKPGALGQSPEEREILERLLALGLVDLGRLHAPDDDALFTWWAPWRKLRERNIGWRIDYILADAATAARSISSHSAREIGTSDHAPVTVTFSP